MDFPLTGELSRIQLLQQLIRLNSNVFWSPTVCIPVQRRIRIYLLIADHRNSHGLKHPAVQNELEPFRIVRIWKGDSHTTRHELFPDILFCRTHSSWQHEYFQCIAMFEETRQFGKKLKQQIFQIMKTNAKPRIRSIARCCALNSRISLHWVSVCMVNTVS